MRLTLLVVASLALAPSAQGQGRWFKGNTHAHSLNSDGDVPVDDVVRWYREHGYHFTFITEHEYFTDVAPLNALFAGANRFLVIAGQEVTQRVADAKHSGGVRQAHVNALGTSRLVPTVGVKNIVSGMTIAQTYARNGAAIQAAGGIIQVNHPNFIWSVPLADMMDLPDSTLFEVWNGHPIVYNLGGTDSTGQEMLSTEARWDSVLSRGKLLFGVADDDSHSYKPQDAENPDMARPGRGWIWVRADTLSADAIVRALRRGDFYASTGITLRELTIDSGQYRLEITPAGDRRYLTEFIGQGGRILARSTTLRPSYRITGSEGYVRARVSDSSGRMAWTQPVRTR
ncbi:MAG TPA: CehA/McbA family metallohydrolase [Gemmatimonadaceae bacterium]|nr:CehA/McbA family metallohydrolase [Gemmatimonadaceae bacterium]